MHTLPITFLHLDRSEYDDCCSFREMLNLFNVYTSYTAPLDLSAHKVTFVVGRTIRVRGLSRTVGAKTELGRIQTPNCPVPRSSLRFRENGLSMRVVLLLLREGSGIHFHESPVVLSHHRKARLTLRLVAGLLCESAVSKYLPRAVLIHRS